MSRSPDHKLAQALDLARREAGLTTAELAAALSFSPRTVRRYLNGERRPEHATVVRWEQICRAEPGTLIALYDGSSASDAPPPPPPSSRPRLPLRSAVAAAAVIVAISAVLLLRGNDEPKQSQAAQQRPTGVAYHRFTASYVGDVWIRITPAREHIGKLHRVTLHWGPIMQTVELKNLDRSRTLFTGKNRPDRVTMRVNVKPAAAITFGERNVSADALDIKPGWRSAE